MRCCATGISSGHDPGGDTELIRGERHVTGRYMAHVKGRASISGGSATRWLRPSAQNDVDQKRRPN
jgi:hypothetical protein